MSVELPTGAIGLNERLHRLEENDQQILRKLETLAKTTEVAVVDARVTAIERSYVSKSTVWALGGFIVVQAMVIIGLGLGLVYELLRKP